jgi:hypothetical protein
MPRFLQRPQFVAYVIISAAVLVSGGLLVSADTASTSVTVGNATPSISATTFNNGTAITLTENTTSVVYATTTVTDANGCSTISGVTADFYRSAVTAGGCDTVGEANNNNCYPRNTCTVVAGTCTGGADTSANYVCNTSLQFYADPTDSGTYSAQNWVATITAGDGSATTTDSTATQELNTLLSLNVTSSISYGTLAANSNTGSINSTTTVTNTGNKDMDPEISGTDLTSGSDYILATYQQYAVNPFAYGAGTALSSTTPASLNITLPQGTSGTVPITDTVSWGISVPAGAVPGAYTGTNTFTAVTGL